jgi:hypothetical protein
MSLEKYHSQGDVAKRKKQEVVQEKLFQKQRVKVGRGEEFYFSI